MIKYIYLPVTMLNPS
uniref:Uncharacterized protein n=1 Tax=Anguilla anguilla TaxID=7936 RepID=A0A0E9R6A2_ANGAN